MFVLLMCSMYLYLQWLKKLSQCLITSSCLAYGTILSTAITLGKLYLIVYHVGFLITKYSFNLDENLKYNKSNKIITHWDSFLTCHSFQQYERISFFFPCTLKYVTCGSLCD